MPFSSPPLVVIPPQRRYPDHPPLMVKDTLFVVKVERTISGFGKVLNKKSHCEEVTVFVTTWQSPERAPLVYNQVIATQSIKRKVPFQGMFRLHFVPLNMTKSNVANCCAFDNIPFFYYTNKVRP